MAAMTLQSDDATPAPSAPPLDLAVRWLAELDAQLPEAARLRREIHREPRVTGREHDTARLLERFLGVPLRTVADAGRIGRIGPEAGPAVGLRAELDALPVQERTGAEFASVNGAMHACGHDVHMAALAALVRAASRVELPAGLGIVLQPREEGFPSGARDIVRSGTLSELRIERMVAAHVHPGVTPGQAAIGGGFVNAAADEIVITLSGRGGHGGYPHLAADPIAAMGHILVGLPEVVRRVVDPFSPAVVSVGTARSGHGASNVLPSEAEILATMRTTRRGERERVFQAVRDFAQGQAASFGVQAEAELRFIEPVLENDERLAAAAEPWLRRLGIGVAEPLRSLGADDFSFFSELMPSVMCFVGVRTPGLAQQPMLHDAAFLPAEEAIRHCALTLMAGWFAAVETLRPFGVR